MVATPACIPHVSYVCVLIVCARYLAHLVGHEGSGSLLSLLKTKGWANGLSAGPYESATDWASFIVSVECTEKGLVSDGRELVLVVVVMVVAVRFCGRRRYCPFASMGEAHAKRIPTWYYVIPVWQSIQATFSLMTTVPMAFTANVA